MNLSQKVNSEYLVEIPNDPQLKLIFRKLRRGFHVDDTYFDRIFPDWARRPSRIHWTPICVAKRATQILTHGHSGLKILDVGSGGGKFCLVGASINNSTFFGLEQRIQYVELSKTLAAQYQIKNLQFIHGNINQLDWHRFDAFYFFNPYLENKLKDQCIDWTVQLGQDKFTEYVHQTETLLKGLPQGARVVTYFGFGGHFPRSYRKMMSEFCYRGPLELWVKEI